jgi:hypothetical protein
MTTVYVALDSVKVTEGQGIGEGNFELNIKVQEGSNIVHWPAPYPSGSSGIHGVDKKPSSHVGHSCRVTAVYHRELVTLQV